MSIKTGLRWLLRVSLLLLTMTAQGAEYLIDASGGHASVNFQFEHLGIGRITGQFRDFNGRFYYDPAQPDASWVKVSIRTASLDSNQAARDRNIRSPLFLDVEQFPTAQFESSSVAHAADGSIRVFGTLTLHGVARKIELRGRKLGEIEDGWGRHRVAFEAAVTLNTLDFGMRFPPTNEVSLTLYLEGIRSGPN